jgi:hypothetical protein
MLPVRQGRKVAKIARRHSRAAQTAMDRVELGCLAMEQVYAGHWDERQKRQQRELRRFFASLTMTALYG